MYNPIQLTNTIPTVRTFISRSPLRHGFLLIPLALACFALSPQARAVCQRGCGSNDNTFLGGDALINNTGFDNTAIGFEALVNNTFGQFNTAIGSQTLVFNTGGFYNTAIGFRALLSNTDGYANVAAGFEALNSNTTGYSNTANGVQALFTNTTGVHNTAIGDSALYSNTTGSVNTANGDVALYSNTTGTSNTAIGVAALSSNTTGNFNSADGFDALYFNTTGNLNTANGAEALFNNTVGFNNTATGYQALDGNTTGNYNTATGQGALFSNTTGRNNTADGQNAMRSNTTGSFNIALGDNAGFSLTTGDNNIEIGNRGVAGEAKTIRIGKQGTQRTTFIAGISGAIVPTGVAVIVDASGHLGTTTSSARFKDAIKPMDKGSEAILALKPVTFHYKQELDPEGIPQFGLVAEDVEKVNPDLVARDEEGKPYSVRYEAVNMMLLNEFLKEHRTVQELKTIVAKQEAIIAQQQQGMEAVTARLEEQASQIQKMSAEFELRKSSPQIVVNDR